MSLKFKLKMVFSVFLFQTCVMACAAESMQKHPFRARSTVLLKVMLMCPFYTWAPSPPKVSAQPWWGLGTYHPTPPPPPPALISVLFFGLVDISANSWFVRSVEQHSFKVKDCLRRLGMLFTKPAASQSAV